MYFFFFFQAEDGIRDLTVTGVQTCALPIYADEEGVGARPSREAGRLGVEEEEPARIPGRRLGARHGGEKIERRRERRPERLAAVGVRQRILAPHDEERPGARLDELAAQHFVGGGRGGARPPPRPPAAGHAAGPVVRLVRPRATRPRAAPRPYRSHRLLSHPDSSPPT